MVTLRRSLYYEIEILGTCGYCIFSLASRSGVVHRAIVARAILLQSHKTVGQCLVVTYIIICSRVANHLEVAINLITWITIRKFAARSHILHLYLHLSTSNGHVELDKVEASRLWALLIANLIETVLCIERCLIEFVLCSKLIAYTCKVEAYAALSICKEFLLVVVVADAEDAHICLRCILWILRLVPDATQCLVTVFVCPVVLQEVRGIALPLVLEMTMALSVPHIVPTTADGLLRIVLIRLPLSALLPESTSTVRTLVTITET